MCDLFSTIILWATIIIDRWLAPDWFFRFYNWMLSFWMPMTTGEWSHLFVSHCRRDNFAEVGLGRYWKLEVPQCKINCPTDFQYCESSRKEPQIKAEVSVEDKNALLTLPVKLCLCRYSKCYAQILINFIWLPCCLEIKMSFETRVFYLNCELSEVYGVGFHCSLSRE